MERDHAIAGCDLIELGSVSQATHGAMGEMMEPLGFWHMTGIADE